MNTAVNQIDQLTQQNAAMVEESTAAAAQLRQHAAQLAEGVARFRLGEIAADREAAANPVRAQQARLARAAGKGLRGA